MGKALIAILIGLALGAGGLYWWLGGHPRTLAQPSDQLAGWAVVRSSESIAVAGGGTTWVLSAELRLRNITGRTVAVTVPAQRFLVVLGDGSTVVGHLTEAATSSIAKEQTGTVILPKVAFFSRSKDAASVLIALDDGDGLRLFAAPVGDEPPAKPVEPVPPAAVK